MAKQFIPQEFNYELIGEKTAEGICHYQRVISSAPKIYDVIEISHLSKQKVWVIFIEAINLKQFLPKDVSIDESIKISLFVGEIKSAFEYELIMKRICTDPKILIQLGA